MFLVRPTIVLVSMVLLSGCSMLTTPYVRPDLPGAPGWVTTTGTPSRVADTEWWRSFGSADINILVTAALMANPDIAAASLRARRAALQAEQASVALLPKLFGSVNSSGSSGSDGGPGAQSHAVSFGASYEIDLWGRLSAQQVAGQLEAMASQEDVDAARVTVVASVIETYWRLGAANRQIAQAKASLETAKKAQALVASQVSLGVSSQLDTQDSTQTVATQQAGMTDLLQAREVLRNALAVLLNGQASPVKEPTSLPSRTPITVAAGLPADLLSNRPDLKAAELRLRASLTGVDAAQANLYPQISLTAGLGSSSSELLQALSNPVATLGSGLVLPFLNFRENQLSVRLSQLQYEEAVVNFRRTLLLAFSDVGIALGSHTQLSEKAHFLRQALAAAQEAEALTEQRYRAGAITLRVWLDSQERLRGAEATSTAVRLEQLLNELQLFRVLGAAPN